jgi:predicted thioesterase
VVGLRSSLRIVVAPADTAPAVGSGDVPVLATPRLLALAEEASVAAIALALEPGVTSVGTSAVIQHTRASPVGAEVDVEAQLAEVDGRRLVFTFTAAEPPPAGPAAGAGAVVGSGTIERVLVDRKRFLSRAQQG